jgi:hypothetical protein
LDRAGRTVGHVIGLKFLKQGPSGFVTGFLRKALVQGPGLALLEGLESAVFQGAEKLEDLLQGAKSLFVIGRRKACYGGPEIPVAGSNWHPKKVLGYRTHAHILLDEITLKGGLATTVHGIALFESSERGGLGGRMEKDLGVQPCLWLSSGQRCGGGRGGWGPEKEPSCGTVCSTVQRWCWWCARMRR